MKTEKENGDVFAYSSAKLKQEMKRHNQKSSPRFPIV
jgi:hypothetical protein